MQDDEREEKAEKEHGDKEGRADEVLIELAMVWWACSGADDISHEVKVQTPQCLQGVLPYCCHPKRIEQG